MGCSFMSRGEWQMAMATDVYNRQQAMINSDSELHFAKANEDLRLTMADEKKKQEIAIAD